MEIDQWLIRTAENWIAGPYPKEQVRKMVLEGKLGLQDEICSANGYWLYLHEHAEIQKALGVQIPKSSNGDEVTETQIPTGPQETRSETRPAPSKDESKTATGTVIRKSIFEPLMEQAQSLTARNEAHQAEEEAEREADPEDDGSTRVSTLYQSGTRSGAQASPELRGLSKAHEPHVTGSSDQRPSMWKGLVWMMVLAGVVLLGVVVRLIINR